MSQANVTSSHDSLSRWTLRLDGIFLALAGGSAMVTETVGHFVGVGPMAGQLGSPYTIGSFEAHGLAIIFAVLLLRASARADRRLWHAVGMSIHVLLGSSNILFWSSFAQMGMVVVGIVTTSLHIVFVVAQGACLRVTRAGEA